VRIKFLFVTLLSVVLHCLPGSAVAQARPGASRAPNSPIRNHFVTTLLGSDIRQAIGDSRLEEQLGTIDDYGFLPSGDMIAIVGSSRVFRIGTDGLLRPFAGNGTNTSSGDGGPAQEAGVLEPMLVAVSSTGAAYIHQADGVIRKVSADGTIQTLGGNGNNHGCATVGALATETAVGLGSSLAADAAGNVYFAPTSCQMVYRLGVDRRITVAAGDGFTFHDVRDLNVDSEGNLFFTAMYQGQRILFRRDSEGVLAQVLSGRGTSSQREGPLAEMMLLSIQSVAVASDGRMAIANVPKTLYESNNYRDVQQLGLVAANGNYSVLFAGDGYNSKPTGKVGNSYILPVRLRFHPSGDLFVQDSKTQAIFRIPQSGQPERFVGAFDENYFVETGANPRMATSTISSLGVDANGVLTFLGQSAKVYRFTPNGTLSHIAGNGQLPSGDGGPALQQGLSASGLSYDKLGNIYFSSSVSVGGRTRTVIRRIDAQGMLKTIAGGGTLSDGWDGIDALSVDFTRGVERVVSSPSGEVYFLTSDRDGAGFIWKLGLDGKITRIAGAGPYWGSGPLEEGKLARETDLPRLGRLTVDDAGVLYFEFVSSGWAFYRIDGEGLIRSVVNYGSGDRATVDGEPTVSAPSYFQGSVTTHAPGKFLVRNVDTLSEYVADGKVTIWHSSNEGIAWADGLRVYGNLGVGSSQAVLLPDSGIAWVSGGTPYQTLRRTIPVPADCSYSPSSLNLAVPSSGETAGIGLNTASHCPWAVGASSYWIELPDKRHYQGTSQLGLRFRENPSSEPRTGYLYVAGTVIPVTQAGNGDATAFVVTPSTADVPAAGGQVRIDIQASATTPWTIVLPQTGISADGALSGVGSAVRVLNVSALEGSAFRTLLVAVNSHTITIRQSQQQGAVPVDIVSTVAGSTVVVDGQERSAPYRAFWLPGSTHMIAPAKFLRNGEFGLWQFRQWQDGSKDQERSYTVPGSEAVLRAEYRDLAPLVLESRVNGEVSSSNTGLVPTYFGVAVDPIWRQQMGLGERTYFYPKGLQMQVLSVEDASTTFTGYQIQFLGGQSETTTSSRGLLSITVDRPLRVIAEFQQKDENATNKPSLVVPSTYTLRFQEEVKNGNPLAFPVTSDGLDLPGPAEIFVHYATASEDAPDWLQTRLSGHVASASVLEVKLSANAPEWKFLGRLGDRSAFVYVHSDGARPGRLKLDVTPYTQDLVFPERYTIVDAITDAGGFRQAMSTSPGSILTLFGSRLASDAAQAPSLPLPTQLAGTAVSCTGAPGGFVPLFYVGPGQVNFQIPEGWKAADAFGRIACTASAAGFQTAKAISLKLEAQTVSLFTANSSGLGPAAGMAVWALADGTQRREELASCAGGACSVKTLRRQPGEALYLELYGTGFSTVASADIRVLLDGKDVPVAYVGANSQFVGLSQLNLRVPDDVRTGQDLDFYVWVRSSSDSPWQSSNRLTIRFE